MRRGEELVFGNDTDKRLLIRCKDESVNGAIQHVNATVNSTQTTKGLRYFAGAIDWEEKGGCHSRKPANRRRILAHGFETERSGKRALRKLLRRRRCDGIEHKISKFETQSTELQEFGEGAKFPLLYNLEICRVGRATKAHEFGELTLFFEFEIFAFEYFRFG